MSHQLWNLINELQSEKYEWLDLSHSLNNDSPYWAGIPEGAVELCLAKGNCKLKS